MKHRNGTAVALASLVRMPLSAPASRRLKIGGAITAAAVAALLLVALLLLSFGWGLLRPLAERRLSAALGRPVTIARIHRVGGGLLHPLLAVEGVRVPQPGWAGQGDMARLGAARLRVAALPLLVGRFAPQLVLIDGLRLALIRGADGRGNWERPGPKTHAGGASPDLGQLVVRDAIVRLDDRKYLHRFTLRLAVDDVGFRLNGPGSIGGSPATVAIEGPPVRGTAPWPFRAEIRSPVVRLLALGRMRTPLDLGHFTARVASSGRDFTDLDHVIEAGLFPTQDFRLTATVTHDRPGWRIEHLAGTVGRSDVLADIAIGKQGARTTLTGGFVSQGFDFDDLASDAGLAQAAAEARRLGSRAIPATRIDLSRVRLLDGTLHVDIRRILSRTPTIFRSVKGVVTLNHGVLTAAPMTAGLASGTLAGSFVVRHQSGAPLLLVDLRLTGGRLETLVRTGGVLAGPLAGRARLRGHGSTVREAIGRSDGRVAVASRGGSIARRVALFLGSDVGRGLFAGDADKVAMTCLVGDFAVRGGIARPDPLVIDTPVARADASGRVTLADERVAIDFLGAPKRNSLLRLNGPISASGTLEQPAFNPPPQTKTAGGLLAMIGKALGGHRQAMAGDADCAALAQKALR